jgi:ribosomal protein S18 acetylase RimI-like enzyme
LAPAAPRRERDPAALTAADIDSIERATLAAVSPEATEEIPGWLLAFDRGTVSRARSAAPLLHTTPDAAVLDEIEARYRAHRLPAMFRVPDIPAFDGIRATLVKRGYTASKPTEVHTAATSGVMRIAVPDADVALQPDEGWAQVFLGEGFDPVDGASRVAILSRASGTLFASVREQGRTVAAGAGAFAHGWASVHGMRTAQDRRGRALAARVLATLAAAAASRGHSRMFLQVEAHNPPAQALYRRAGFGRAWTYVYWKQP